MEKIWYSHTRHTWQYNAEHAHCMLDNWGYIHPLGICNTYCFFTSIMVTRTRLVVTFKYSACHVARRVTWHGTPTSGTADVSKCWTVTLWSQLVENSRVRILTARVELLELLLRPRNFCSSICGLGNFTLKILPPPLATHQPLHVNLGTVS